MIKKEKIFARIHTEDLHIRITLPPCSGLAPRVEVREVSVDRKVTWVLLITKTCVNSTHQVILVLPCLSDMDTALRLAVVPSN